MFRWILRLVSSCLAIAIIAVAMPAFAATSIPFTINLSEAVNVTGTPRIAVTVGGSPTRYADYTSGSGTSTLTFTYTMVAGDIDLDGIALASPIQLNGGTIKDLNGNDAALTFTVPNTSNVKVDYPSLGMDFVYDSDGRYSLNGTVYNDLTSFLSATSGSFTRPSIGTYFNSSGVLQTAASGAPRFDYDPTNANAAKGLLIEESRTNGIRNNTMVGAVAGTPGTPPTNWSIANGAGLSTQIVGTGTDNGINYIDVRFFGTSSSGPTYPGIYFETPTQFAAAPNAIATTSAYVKLVGGSWTNATTQLLVMYNATSAGAGLSQFATSVCVPTSSALNTQRCKVTSAAATFSNASTAYLRPYFQFTVASAGLAIDVTVRIGMPQIELAAFATSVIPTSGATVTRSADTFTVNASGWAGSTEGTLFYQSNQTSGASTVSAAFEIWQDFNNKISSRGNTDLVNVSNITQVANGVSVTQGSTQKRAFAYKANDFVSAKNGSIVATDTVGSLFSSPTLARIGNTDGNASYYYNGTIAKAKYYPFRLLNTQLQLLTQ